MALPASLLLSWKTLGYTSLACLIWVSIAPRSARADSGWALSVPADSVLHFQPHTREQAMHLPRVSQAEALHAPMREAARLAYSGSAANIGTLGWQEWGGSARAEHALVRDLRRQRWLSLGGSFRLDVQGSVSASDPQSGAWSQITARPDNGTRWVLGAVDDSLRDRLLVLTIDPMTYAYSLDACGLAGLDWHHLWSGPSLAGAWNAGVAIDTKRDEFVILGGHDPGTGVSSLVHVPLAVPGAATWTSISGTGLPVVTLGNAVYVPAHDCFEVIFDQSGIGSAPGGYTHGSGLYRITAGASPVATAQAGANFPSGSPRTLAYDAITDRLFVADEYAEALAISLRGEPLQRLDDAHSYDSRDGAALGFDPITRRLILYGGQRSDEALPLFESIAVDSGIVWTIGNPPGTTPWRAMEPGGVGSRIWHQSILDPQTSRAIVFGGHQSAAGFSHPAVSAHAIGTIGGWAALGAASLQSPRERFLQSVVYDPMHHALLVFGGQATDGTGELLGDLWSLSLGQGGVWTQFFAAGGGPKARNMAMIFDAPRQRFLLFGGDDLVKALTRVWELRLTPAPVWREIGFAGEPAPTYPTVFADPGRGDGWSLTSGFQIHHLTFEADSVRSSAVPTVVGANWAVGNPTAMCFDAPHRRLLSIWTPSHSSARGDLSRLFVHQLGDSAVGSVVPVPGAPPGPRYLFSMSYDASSNQVVTIGGYDDDATYFGDAWQLGFVEPTPTLASLQGARADEQGAHLRWFSPTADASGEVERSPDGAQWTKLGVARREGSDLLGYDDPTLAPGSRAAYRLRITSQGATSLTAATWLARAATTTLSLVAWARQPGQPLVVHFTLAPGADAQLRLLDVAGRARASVRVTSQQNAWEFREPLEVGLYFAELTQGAVRRTARVLQTR